MKTNLILYFSLVAVVLAGDEFAGKLKEHLMSIKEDDTFITNRVKFSRGGSGVKVDDLILSEEQNDWLFGEEDDSGNRTKRAGTEIKRGINFWPNGIVPYIINARDFDAEEQRQLRAAMDIYEDLTCLKFIQRTQERQWIFIQHTNDGCYSYLGDARAYSPGPQPVSLQKPGCRHFGTYLHELGHAVGLVHEHQLPTRDRHVRYYGTNVDPNNVSQLKIYNARVVNTFNTPYDLGSIMHYDITSFSIDDMSPTLGVDNPFLAQHIGRRYSDMLSFGDIRTINHLYKCNAKCSQIDRKTCPDPGFLNEKCDCVTPQSYFQRYCKDEDGLEQFCQKLVPAGKCDIQNLEHHKSCKKSCGFCPLFKPGDTAIGPKQAALGRQCVDRYYNPRMCKAWSGYCQKSPWMHRYCRATCGACKSQWGDCANLERDSICDMYARMKLCTRAADRSFQEFLQVNCADSCGTCGVRNQDRSCRNVANDQQCNQLALQQQCEQNPLKMFTQCPSTCNRCYWNRGSCRNRASDNECIQMALQNLCIAGEPKRMQEMKRLCAKTCDTC